jgi:hypothetical protein
VRLTAATIAPGTAKPAARATGFETRGAASGSSW